MKPPSLYHPEITGILVGEGIHPTKVNSFSPTLSTKGELGRKNNMLPPKLSPLLPLPLTPSTSTTYLEHDKTGFCLPPGERLCLVLMCPIALPARTMGPDRSPWTTNRYPRTLPPWTHCPHCSFVRGPTPPPPTKLLSSHLSHLECITSRYLFIGTSLAYLDTACSLQPLRFTAPHCSALCVHPC